MNAIADLDDVRWLVGDDAADWLERAAQHQGSLTTLVRQLRAALTPTRAHLVTEQVELRQRAREKFSRAEHLYFTRIGLEQATDEVVACYKAGRFPTGMPVADLCCGIGGDLLALAGRGPAVGVDRDAATALMARANLSTLFPVSPRSSSDVLVAEVDALPLDDFAAWHIDPDRRAAGRRTTRIEQYAPPLEAIERLRARLPHAAIKLAPAAEPPEAWRREGELEWISRDGQCRQQVAWFGDLAQRPGEVAATILRRHDADRRTVCGRPGVEIAAAPQPGRFVYEPDAAVLAAELTGALAEQRRLAPLAAGHVYLTGDTLIDDAALAAFEVDEVLPLDLKKLRGLFRQRGIGRLEIKTRGVQQDPDQLRRQLASTGAAQCTLLVTRLGQRVVAIVARRVVTPR